MPDELRKKAEELLNRNPAETPVLATKDVQRLVHELDVHQIELQMQNEELCTAQAGLAHARDIYVELFDFAPVGYLVADPDGRIVDANFAAAGLLGLERGKLLVGRTFASFVSPESLNAWELHRRHVLDLQAKQSTELILQRPDGSLLHVHIECTPHPGSGRCLMALVDITERMQAEDALRKSEQKLAELNLDLERLVDEQTAELRESEERFRRMFEEAPDACFLIGLDGRFIDGNKAVEDQTGYTCEELSGRGVFESEIFPSLARKTAVERMARLAQGERLGPMEYQLVHKDGRELCVEVSTTPIHFEGKRVFLSHARDLTFRKQAEKQLHESEVRFRELFSRMASGVAVYEVVGDGADFVFKDVNASGERINGIKKADVVGRSVQELFPGIRKMGLFDVFQRVWRTGKPERYPITRYQDERIQRWLENQVFKLPSGEVVAIYEDRTAWKQAEQELKESEEKYRMLFDSETDAVLIFDGETRRFVDVNHAAEELYGYTREEFLQLTQSAITAEPEDSDITIRQTLKREISRVPLRQHRKKDGSIFPVEISVCTFSWKGHPVVCGVIRDITERIARAEELRRLSAELSLAEQRERDRVAYELHEGLSQLLSSVGLRLGMLKEMPLPTNAAEVLGPTYDIVKECLQQTRSLTFELSCPMLSELGLGAALEELCASLTKEYSIHFEFKGERQPLPLPMERKVVLSRCVRELLINVIKHSGATRSSVGLQREVDRIRIRVEDNGAGFDASRAGNGFSPSGGFGLFNIRESVQHIGGNLKIESVSGRGAVVVLSVPLDTGDESSKSNS